jgi:hypothetical protein
MIEPSSWLGREFQFDQSAGMFAALLERVRGTPARAAELIVGFSENDLAHRVNGSWSAKEHLGHLADLQPLDERRLQEFLAHASVLSPADTSNRATKIANHNEKPTAELLARLRDGRDALVQKLEVLTDEEVMLRAVHPRLQKAMRLVDWVYFVAEHDDNHLAKARFAAMRARP